MITNTPEIDADIESLIREVERIPILYYGMDPKTRYPTRDIILLLGTDKFAFIKIIESETAGLEDKSTQYGVLYTRDIDLDKIRPRYFGNIDAQMQIQIDRWINRR